MKNKISNQFVLASFFASTFFLVGFSSLIYQIIWQRCLTAYYGADNFSVMLIMAIYMCGLGVGSLLGGFLVEKFKDWLSFFCFIEIILGCFGLVSLDFMKILSMYSKGSQYLLPSGYIFLFLCVPTLLIGMTFPILIKMHHRLTSQFLYSISCLYNMFYLGLAYGILFTGYIIFSLFGFKEGLFFAAGIHFLLALLIFYVKFNTQAPFLAIKEEFPFSHEDILGKRAYFCSFIIGFLTLGYQTIWFRLISVLIKNSVYVYVSIMFVFFWGLSLGSQGVLRAQKKNQKLKLKNLFFTMQFLLGFTVLIIFISYYYLSKYTIVRRLTDMSFQIAVHPLIPYENLLLKEDLFMFIYSWLDIIFWPMIFIFIPIFFMGASYPLISSLALKQPSKEALTVGAVYAMMLFGNIIAIFITNIFLLPLLGTEQTLLLFIIIGLFFGFFITHIKNKKIPLLFRMIVVSLIICTGIIFFPKPSTIYEVMYPRLSHFQSVFREGQSGTAMTYYDQTKIVNYLNGDLIEEKSFSFPYDSNMLETLKYASEIKNVLFFGEDPVRFLETIRKFDAVEEITVVMLNDILVENFKQIPVYSQIFQDAKVKLFIMDARRFLTTNRQQYDLICLYPVKHTTSYSNHFLSYEFFKLIKHHLKYDGIFMIKQEELKIVPHTIGSVFEFVRLYNTFCLSSNKVFEQNELITKRILQKFPFQSDELDIEKKVQFLYDEQGIKTESKYYPLNDDHHPISEYYLGFEIKKRFFWNIGEKYSIKRKGIKNE